MMRVDISSQVFQSPCARDDPFLSRRIFQKISRPSYPSLLRGRISASTFLGVAGHRVSGEKILPSESFGSSFQKPETTPISLSDPTQNQKSKSAYIKKRPSNNVQRYFA